MVMHSIGEFSDVVCTREIVSDVVGMSRNIDRQDTMVGGSGGGSGGQWYEGR